MPQDTQIYELPGDMPVLPTPLSGVSSHPSLRPRPLNFSRPRPHGANSYGFRNDTGPSTPRPQPESSLGQANGHEREEEEEEEEEDDDDDAAPPPVIKTYANLGKLDISRGDSIDEALPPPIRGLGTAFNRLRVSRADSVDTDSIADSFDEALPQPIRTYQRSNDNFNHWNEQGRDSIDANSIADSFDEALPQPIRTNQRSNDNLHRLNGSRAESIYEDLPVPPVKNIYAPPPITRNQYSGSSKNTQPSSRGDSLVEASFPHAHKKQPPSALKKQESAPQQIIETKPDGPRVCIYRPYLDYASSHRPSFASSRATDSTDESNTSQVPIEDDQGSVAGSESTEYSSMADFAYDGQLGWNTRSTTPHATDASRQQRWSAPTPLRIPALRSKGKERQEQPPPPPPPIQQRPRHGSTASSEHTLYPATSKSSTGSGSSKPPVPPPRIPRIVKRTSIDQMSERVNHWQGESMSDRGSISSSEWKSSDVDTSGLSVEKIHKLKKKGINPALYVEMKNARKGKSKWLSPLQGNSFIS